MGNSTNTPKAADFQQLDQFIQSLPQPALGVTADSRQISPGSVFIAIAGGSFDGHDFIAQAVAQGAIAVVGERPQNAFDLPVPYLSVADARLAWAYLSARQQNFPARQLTMIGVTGTDGKTTTVNLIFDILKAAGLRAGMISTVKAVIGDREEATGLHVTTPDAPAVQAYLAEMVAAGLSHCVLETTSHGLAQHRVSVCDFDIAVVTNITHEHLDFHGDYPAYQAAKAMLFEGLHTAARKPPQPKVAVLNRDDTSFEYLNPITADRRIGYALAGPADLTVRNLRFAPDSTEFDLVTPKVAFPVRTHLVGDFNVSNVLAAAGAALGLVPALPMQVLQHGIANLNGIPGRMERVDGGQRFLLVVDFAHTPNALQRAVQAGRRMIPDHGRVITVFGSAGLRDVAKRRMMSEISARFADLTVLTAEDPRTESLDQILADMAAGCAAKGGVEGQSFFRVPDRMRAIHFALNLARPGDIVMVCGKGHEQSMCFGKTEYPWDDRQATRQALNAFLADDPVPDSGLPTFA